MKYCIIYGFKNGMKICETFENEQNRNNTFNTRSFKFLDGTFKGAIVDGQAFKAEDLFIIVKQDIDETKEGEENVSIQ